MLKIYRRMVNDALLANVQTYFERVTALSSYEATVKVDAKTGERLKN